MNVCDLVLIVLVFVCVGGSLEFVGVVVFVEILSYFELFKGVDVVSNEFLKLFRWIFWLRLVSGVVEFCLCELYV